MLKYLTNLSTLGLLALGLLLLFVWLVASETLRAVAPLAIYSLVGLALLGGVIWLLFFAWRQYHLVQVQREQRQAFKAEAQSRALKAGAEAGLAQAKAQAGARMLAARVRKAERAADLFVVTAADGEQVFISDTNLQGHFVAAHLQLSGHINGRPIEPGPLQVAAWERWHTVRTAQAAPALSPAAPQQSALSLPEKVDLLSLLPPQGPSIDRIALGLKATSNGLETVSAPLADLVHIGVGGSSGWGKSVFLQALAFQIALSQQQAQLALIDIEAHTFSPFINLALPGLRYPVADEERDILAILQDLSAEMARRKALYRACPQAADLAEFNTRVGPEAALPPIALIIDESTALLENDDITATLIPLTWRARKYGIFCILGGQDWGASSVPTKLRNMFSTRIQFKAMGKAQSRVMLENSAAAEIEQPGRAYAVLRGQPLFELQAPFIQKGTMIEALAGQAGGDAPAMPRPQAAGHDVSKQTDRTRQIQALLQAGKSNDEIARALGYKRAAGAIFYEIKAIREATTATAATE